VTCAAVADPFRHVLRGHVAAQPIVVRREEGPVLVVPSPNDFAIVEIADRSGI
jgi:hypothetical protein